MKDNFTVLIVEDEENYSERLKECLRICYGDRVTSIFVARSIEEALDVFVEKRDLIDLVLMDGNLDSTHRRLRLETRSLIKAMLVMKAGLKIIAVSASNEFRSDMLKVGCTAGVPKGDLCMMSGFEVIDAVLARIG